MFWSFGIIGLILSHFGKRVPLKSLHTHINRLNKTESAIFVSVSLMCSSLSEDLHSKLILSSLQLVLCRVAAVKRLPVHHHSADYMFSGPLESFGSFGISLQIEFR